MWIKALEKFVSMLVSAVFKEALERVPEVWQKAKEWWSGKTIAVIGPTASGKNSMFNRLKKIPPPSEHVQTRGAEQVGKIEIDWTLPDSTKFSMTCKKNINVGGEVDERERYWEQSCTGADVIFYLVDGSKLVLDQGTTLIRVRDDIKWLAKKIHSFKPGVVIHILINKIDIAITAKSKDAAREEMISLFAPGIHGLETLLQGVLGKYNKMISGVTPISMLDDYYFRYYFSEALIEIREKMTMKATS